MSTTRSPISADPAHFMDQLRALRARRLLIVVVAVVTTLVALGYSLLRKPIYTATATVSFQQSQRDLGLLGAIPTTSIEPDKDAAAQAQSVVSDPVMRAAGARLAPNVSPQRLRSSVQAIVEPTSDLIDVQATAGTGALAARIANEVASQAVTLLTQEERSSFVAGAARLAGQARRPGLDRNTRQLYSESISRLLALSSFASPVALVKQADIPQSPSSPRPLRDTLLGLVLGLILGVLAGFARNAFDQRFHDAHEIEAQMDLPVIGHISLESLGRGAPMSADSGFSDNDLESFRVLRSSQRLLDVDRRVTTLLVTSAVAEEGKSTVAMGISYANTLAGARTLLVECDLRRPVLARRLGLDEGPGLTDYLSGEAAPEEIVQLARFGSPTGELEDESALPAAQTACITAGTGSPRPTELLASNRFREFLEEVRSAYDLVVLDSAPVLPVGDTLELLSSVDGILMCVKLRSTTRRQASTAKRTIDRFPSDQLAVVVTGVRKGLDLDYYDYSGYRYAKTDAA